MAKLVNTDPQKPVFNHHCQVSSWLIDLQVPVVHQLAASQFSRKTRSSAAAAKENRRLEFQAGRHCADAALTLLGCNLSEADRVVGVNQDRSPSWPTGYVGSISHSANWTWAAVANQSQVVSTGIDTEAIMTTETMNEVRGQVAADWEWDAMSGNSMLNQQWTDEELTTLLFSAKEAFYKCWFPLHQQFFGFHNAIAKMVSPCSVRILNGQASPNHGLGPEFLDVYFLKTDKDVFTLTWMAKE
jgi:enterobactin synthetase component D